MEIHSITNKVNQGDLKAFQFLVESHQQYAFRLAFRILCNEDDASDAVQDAFVKVWKKINTYTPHMKFINWLSKIVVNTAIDHLRRNSRHKETSLDAVLNTHNEFSDWSIEEQMENKQLGELINGLTESLPGKQKAIFTLRDIEGMTAVDVAEVLDIPESSVKSNLYHARKRIGNKLKGLIQYERRSS